MTTALRRLPRWGQGALVTLAVALVAALAALSGTVAYAHDYEAEERLLPGTTVAGLDVGELVVDEAHDLVSEELNARLDHEVELRDDEASWSVTPRELGAEADAAGALAEAVEGRDQAGWGDLARMRWLGDESGPEVRADIELPEEAVRARIAAIADEIDAGIDDATLVWDGEAYEVRGHTTGREVERGPATAALEDALHGARDTVDVPVDEEPPDITEADARDAAPRVQAATDAALDRVVELVDGDASWEVTPREFGGDPANVRALRDAAVADPQANASTLSSEVTLELDEGEVGAYVDDVAAEIDAEARDASIDYSSGWIEITDSSTGRTLDRDTTTELALEALQDEQDTVELPVDEVAPGRTRDDFHDVVLLRQAERRVYHYVDGEIAADWPVAIGTNDSPTPTGVFGVGAKRHMPTWHNPAPDGWGQDMDEVVGPGRDNPLGVRALNWVQGGRDTLIRFHGTPDTGSIGNAASNGCVRMHNDHVIELYDRVPQGATIVSI
ncbi:hypothetical protein ER308_21190 [Egibacter rhizosphaerae]|uniref:L,D-TPase catalytic domain-containing protein n=1 Tax=Egibacter rhizosphaerae TaxID=1670831 RepID=A0A411YKW8_9ACTN|nr:L,D-transpeptidase/peptidoglycan binding protein [Egibacter rhizosphaerae]QBI21823.1 hypothetical protein ER308_21190 [Egibacter rhizosphaerae]